VDAPSEPSQKNSSADQIAQKSDDTHQSKRMLKKTARYHHNVYVIELDRAVLKESRFRRANPEYDPGKPCVYVGMTGLTVQQRFANHRKGVKSNRFAHQYGIRLLPELYECFNPMPYEGAREMEVELAVGLREEGYGVWQG
jgi:ubiquitin C-terminal hydrolase